MGADLRRDFSAQLARGQQIGAQRRAAAMKLAAWLVPAWSQRKREGWVAVVRAGRILRATRLAPPASAEILVCIVRRKLLRELGPSREVEKACHLLEQEEGELSGGNAALKSIYP